MNVPVQYWAILLAAIVNMVLGALWFGPLFGKSWAKHGGMGQHEMEKAKEKGMTKNYALMFGGSLLMAYVLAQTLIFANAYLNTSGLSSGLMIGFMSWVGFIVPVTIGVVLWNGKSWMYWLITYAYNLVGLLLMGAILALWL